MRTALLLLVFLTPLAAARAGEIEEIRVTDLDEAITLRADGSAEYAFRGKWNAGLVDERVGHFRAKFDPREFRRLAAQPGAMHFGELKDFYLPYSTSISRTTVVRDGKAKTLERNDRGVTGDPDPPADLWGLEMAARGLASRLRWEALPSGVRVRLGGEGKVMHEIMVRVAANDVPVASMRSAKSEVEFSLKPGVYKVEVSVLRAGRYEDAWKEKATVKPNAYASVAPKS